MEKPFCIGESIAGESFSEIPPPNLLPTLDVENEIQLALTSKKAFGNNGVTQKMKELGLERYWVFPPFSLLLFIFEEKRNSRLSCN